MSSSLDNPLTYCRAHVMRGERKSYQVSVLSSQPIHIFTNVPNSTVCSELPCIKIRACGN